MEMIFDPTVFEIIEMDPEKEEKQYNDDIKFDTDADLIYRCGIKTDCINGTARQPTKAQPLHYFSLVIMVLVMLFLVFSESCLIPALPTISREWGAQASWTPWIVSACNVVTAIWTPIAGSLGDIYGPKIVATVCLVFYCISQIGCAVVDKYYGVIILRAVSGLGKGVFVLFLATVKRTFPPNLIPMAVSLISTMSFLGLSVGFVGGAALIDALDGKWHDIFLITFPFFIVLSACFAFLVPNPGKADNYKERSVDYIGGIILAAGVALFVVGLTISSTWGWDGAGTICFIVIGLVLLPLFFLYDIKVPKDPLIRFRAFKNPGLLVCGVVNFLLGFSAYSIFQ